MFTKEQIEEIYAKINALSRRDSDLPAARQLRGDEFVPLLQEAENRNASLVQIAGAVSHIVEALTREELYRVYYRGNVVIVWTLRNAIAELGVQAGRVAERIRELRDAVGSLDGKLEHQSDAVGRLGLLDSAVGNLNRTVGDLSDLVDRLLEYSPGPPLHTLVIEPVPSGATVVINGEVRTEYTAEEGTEVEWSVSMEGYVSRSGTLALTEDLTLPVELELIRVTLTVNAEPSDALVYIDGAERKSLTVDYGTTVGWAVGAEGYVTQSGSLTLTEDVTLNITLEHEGVVYSDIEITEFSYGDIPASGGNAAPTLKYRQTWGYGSETGGGVIEDGADVSYEGVEEDGTHTEGSLGTTVKERTQVATASVTVTLNGRTATASAEVWQAENKVEEYYGLLWVTWSGERDVTYDAHHHSAILSGYESLQYRRYSSGSTDNFYVVSNGHTTYSDVEECDWARATSTGFVLDENTSTEMRGPHDVMETCESEGETISRTWHVYQEGVEEVERTITFNVNPNDATLTLNGTNVTLSGGTYTMTAKDGDEISWSCEKDGYVSQSGTHTVNGDATITITLEEEVTHYITVKPSILSFTGIVRSAVTVSSDGAWTAESGADWLTLGTYSGEAGETSVTVSASVTDSSRKGTVTFTSEHGKTAYLNVSQFPASGGGTGGDDPDPVEDPDTITASRTSVASGEEFTLTLTGTTAMIVASVMSTSMMTVDQYVRFTIGTDTYELSTEKINIPVDANTTYVCVLETNLSSASVLFAHGDASVTVTVTGGVSSSGSDAEAYSDDGEENG